MRRSVQVVKRAEPSFGPHVGVLGPLAHRVSVRSSSRATLATVLPGWQTSATTSARYTTTWNSTRRRRGFLHAIVSILDILPGASPLIVDVRQTGSGREVHNLERR
jgi:hypothetical protein